jgi:hypothetical protein
MSNLEHNQDRKDSKPPNDGADSADKDLVVQESSEPLKAELDIALSIDAPTAVASAPSDSLSEQTESLKQNAAQAAENAHDKEVSEAYSPLPLLKADTAKFDNRTAKEYELDKLLLAQNVPDAKLDGTPKSNVPIVGLVAEAGSLESKAATSGHELGGTVFKLGIEERHYIAMAQQEGKKEGARVSKPEAAQEAAQASKQENKAESKQENKQENKPGIKSQTEEDDKSQGKQESKPVAKSLDEYDKSQGKQDLTPPTLPSTEIEASTDVPPKAKTEETIPESKGSQNKNNTVDDQQVIATAPKDYLPDVQLNQSEIASTDVPNAIVPRQVEDNGAAANSVGTVEKQIRPDGTQGYRLKIGIEAGEPKKVDTPTTIAQAPKSEPPTHSGNQSGSPVVPPASGAQGPKIPDTAKPTGVAEAPMEPPSSQKRPVSGTNIGVVPATPEKPSKAQGTSAGEVPEQPRKPQDPSGGGAPEKPGKSQDPSGDATQKHPTPKPEIAKKQGLVPESEAHEPPKSKESSPSDSKPTQPIRIQSAPEVAAKMPDASSKYLPDSHLQEEPKVTPESKNQSSNNKQSDTPSNVSPEPTSVANANAIVESKPKQSQSETNNDTVVSNHEQLQKPLAHGQEQVAINTAKHESQNIQVEKVVTQGQINTAKSDIGYLRNYIQLPTYASTESLSARIPELEQILYSLKNKKSELARALVNGSLLSQIESAKSAFLNIREQLLSSDENRTLKPATLKVVESVQAAVPEYLAKVTQFKTQDMAGQLEKAQRSGVLTPEQVGRYVLDGDFAKTAYRVLNRDNESDKALSIKPTVLQASPQLPLQTSPKLTVPTDIGSLKLFSKSNEEFVKVIDTRLSKVAIDQPNNTEATGRKEKLELTPEQKALSVPSSAKDFGTKIQETIKQILLAIKERQESEAYKKRHNFQNLDGGPKYLFGGIPNVISPSYIAQIMRPRVVRNNGDTVTAPRVVVPVPSASTVQKDLDSLTKLSQREKDHSKLAFQSGLGFLGVATNNMTEEQKFEAVARSTNLYASVNNMAGVKLQSEVTGENDNGGAGGGAGNVAAPVSPMAPGNAANNAIVNADDTESADEPLIRASYS